MILFIRQIIRALDNLYQGEIITDFKQENISNIPAGINIRLTSNKLRSNE